MHKIDPKKLPLEARVKKLNSMIGNGQILEAFEKFYAENVIRQVVNYETNRGKNDCRKAEENFVVALTKMRKADVKNTIIKNRISIIEWDFDFLHEKLGDRKYSQIAIQQWDCNSQIFYEVIYRNNLKQ